MSDFDDAISQQLQKQKDVSDISETDRKILLKSFQEFCKIDPQQNNEARDELQSKLKQGKGDLTLLDCYMLIVSIANMTVDKDLYAYYKQLFGEGVI